ncbi:MAG: tol-pal system-associated acyl-CoA thioesterase [Neomegalonema sp.]|nr:tol-pal system-associated acyl-CoA thioesterase [Neomegalonema sp.]
MSTQSVPHRHSVRVYYEDTDLAGIVYYANYLRFIERGRTEWLRSLGIDQSQLRAESGLVFVVRRCNVDYLRPAKMDDMLVVETHLTRLRGASIELSQHILRGEELLIRAGVNVACVSADGVPSRLPEQLRLSLIQHQV